MKTKIIVCSIILFANFLSFADENLSTGETGKEGSIVSEPSNNDEQKTLSEEELYNELFRDGDLQDETNDPEVLVTIVKIKYELSENIDPDWIASLLYFSEGMTLKQGELEKLVLKSKKKLEDMHHFFNVTINVLQSVNDPDNRIVVVRLTDGFWYSFMLWPWDFFVSFNHLYKSAKRLALTVGLDDQSIEFSDPNFFYSPFCYSIKLEHNHVVWNDEYIADSSSVRFAPGVYVTDFLKLSLYLRQDIRQVLQSSIFYPDFKFSLTDDYLAANGLNETNYFFTGGILFDISFPFLFDIDAVSLASTALFAYHYSFSVPGDEYFIVTGDTTLCISPFQFLLFKLHGLGGYNSKDTYQFEKYSLSNAIRGFVTENNRGDFYLALQSSVYVTNIFKLDCGIFYIAFNPFIFYDTGDIFMYGDRIRFDNLDHGFGGGMEIYFSMPVDVIVTFGIKNSYYEKWYYDIIFGIENYVKY
jgi:hypothetical protein